MKALDSYSIYIGTHHYIQSTSAGYGIAAHIIDMIIGEELFFEDGCMLRSDPVSLSMEKRALFL
ncbi:hypothetical protein BG74_08210 [Sodalis-like endosymbiont of Proechinophthirus fluctus]|nr:hypothetical protein BG74_08210 [Sodalis-like endosymbiont of Proechinophthirus fluctus]